MKRWLRRYLGVKCANCSGHGWNEGYSPFASLSTIRPWIRWTCSWCRGSGRLSPEKAAEYEVKARIYEASWHRLDDPTVNPLTLHPDPDVVARDLARVRAWTS